MSGRPGPGHWQQPSVHNAASSRSSPPNGHSTPPSYTQGSNSYNRQPQMMHQQQHQHQQRYQHGYSPQPPGNLSPRSLHPSHDNSYSHNNGNIQGITSDPRVSGGPQNTFFGGYPGGQPPHQPANNYPQSFSYTQHQQQPPIPHYANLHQDDPSIYGQSWPDSSSAQPQVLQQGGASAAYSQSPYNHPQGPNVYKAEDYMQMQSGQIGNMMASSTKDEDGEDDQDGDDLNDGSGIGAKKGKEKKGTSDFVKKLFRMLDDTSYSPIVSWSPTGDSFIVKDMNDFTRHVLPQHFRHSNFASFVRQLNKYDFHKVKKPEEQNQPPQVGVEQLWEFRHPAFVQGREDILEHVKRKVPASKKKVGQGDIGSRDPSPTMPGTVDAAEKGAEEYTKLKDQVAALTASQDQMSSHINNLTKQYQGVIGEMLTFQKNMVQQDQLMQNLIQYLMNLEADRQLEHKTQQQDQHSALPEPERHGLDGGTAFVAGTDAQNLVTSYSDAAKESFAQMSNIAKRAAAQSQNQSGGVGDVDQESRQSATNVQTPLSPKGLEETRQTQSSEVADKGKSRAGSDDAGEGSVFFHPPHFDANENGGANELFNVATNAVDNPSLAGFEGAGLRVFTVGTLQPRASADATGLAPDGSTPAAAALESAFLRSSPGDDGTEKPFGMNVPNLEQLPHDMPKVDRRTTSMAPTPRLGGQVLDGEQQNAKAQESLTPSESGSNMLRVRRSTYVPGWAVPPRVLVVDDDDTCRKLGSKFLQVFGCAIDVAVDGVSAVNKMNLEQYDLVLMDIVMPNLDGVSATSLIREFDPRTPIISMTSNSAPNELLNYMSSGMNDVLPKPFTKEGLLNMLEKHLIHLKTVQKMDEIPKALGLPPVSDEQLQSVLTATAQSAASLSLPSGSLDSSGMGPSPLAAVMGNGPEAVRSSSSNAPTGPDLTHSPTLTGSDEDDSVVNPLAGMGFSDEEYISMLQNLIAAGAVSDSTRGENADSVANVMGIGRGEGVKSKENTPMMPTRSAVDSPGGPSAKKRAQEGSVDGPGEKRSRFTELQA